MANNDIVRTPHRSRLPHGLTPVGDLEDPVAAQHMQEVQDNLEALGAEFRALKESVPEAVDEREYAAKLDDLEALIRALEEKIDQPTDDDDGFSIRVVDDFDSLPDPDTVGDATLGYTKDTDYFYGVRDGAWRINHPFQQATTPTDIGEQAGDLWHDTTNNVIKGLVGSVWRCLHTWPSLGTGRGELVGDVGTTSNKGYWFDGTAWRLYSHFAPS